MAKSKKVKTKRPKAKPKKRMSKGAEFPWEVWHLMTSWTDNQSNKFHSVYHEFKTEAKAKACIKNNRDLIAPVIHHVDIPPMEY